MTGALEIVPEVEAEGARRSAYKDRPPLEGRDGSAAITVAKSKCGGLRLVEKK